MKIKNVIWFDNPQNKKKLSATAGSDGKLKLNENLFNELPELIRVGFDIHSRTLVFEASDGGIKEYKRRRIMNVSGMPEAILKTGLKLPIRFSFTYDDVYSRWIGQIALRKKNAKYDTEQVMALYQPIADEIFYKIGKSTPKDERRAIINLALCEAVNDYSPICGDMEKYLKERITSRLVIDNRQNFSSYTDRSLDAPIFSSDGNKCRLYDFVSDSAADDLSIAEEKIAEEQFLSTLSYNEKIVMQMITNEQSVMNIAKKLNITENEVIDLGRSIGYKRKCFFDE